MLTAERVSKKSSHTVNSLRPARAETRTKGASPSGIGNQAMQRRLIQAKLTVNQPGDRFEQEADRMAEAVVRMPEPLNGQRAVVPGATAAPGLQRMCPECQEELQRSPAPIQRACSECEEELKSQPMLQAKETPGNTPEVTPAIASRIQSLQGSGQPLPPSARGFLEPRFGHDFGHVRIHTGSHADESARSLNALAYTSGSDIVFANGHYSLETTHGMKLLAHELTHVIQQGSERSSGAIQRACNTGVAATPGCVPDPSITPPSTRFLFNVNCDDFAPGQEAALEAFARGLSATATLRVVGLASFDGPADLNAKLSCSRAQRGQEVIRRSAPAGVTISSVNATVGGPSTVHDSNMRAVGIEVSTPPPPETITSQTVATSPGAQTRTTIGVGEVVNLTHAPGSAAWTTSVGTAPLSATNGVTVIFTAPDTFPATTQRITVTAGAATISFDVIAPTTVAQDRVAGTGVKHTVDRPDSGFTALTFLGPDTVNFSNVRWREMDVAGVATPGAYSCNPASGGHCGAGGGGAACPDNPLSSTVVAGKGTQDLPPPDCAYSGHCGGAPPFAPGSLTVDIPYEYKVGTGAFHPIRNVPQVHTLAADASTLTTTKAGATGTTTVAAASVALAQCP